MISKGADLITEERGRQLEQPEWSREEDERHTGGELAYAAICYARPRTLIISDPPEEWPFDEDDWKPKGAISNLIRAGALIAAEIDRLQTLEDTEAAAAVSREDPGILIIQHAGIGEDAWFPWSTATWFDQVEADAARDELTIRHGAVLRFRVRRFIPDPDSKD